MTYRAIADDRLALDDFHEHVQMVIGEDHPDMFTYRGGVSTDTDEVPIAVHANSDVACEAQNAFRT